MRNLLILTLIVFTGFSLLQAQNAEPVTLLFAGDVTLSDNVEKAIGTDTSYVFRLWKPGEEADIFMVNLEHPVTRVTERVEKKYNFKMNPAAIGTLKDGRVSLVNCANNHVFDYGLQGIEETIRNLDSAGVKYVGIGKNLRDARAPIILDTKGRRFGFLGYYGGGDFEATAKRAGFAPRYERFILEDVRSLKKKVDFVVVNFHWGTERAPEPDTWQVRLAHRVVDAGADLIFTEALATEADFEKFRAAVDTPLLANMTEFGKSSLISAKTLEEIGFNAVIYPVTTLRLAMFAIEKGLREIFAEGTQEGLLGEMQHRSRLYEILEYERYNEFDSGIFNFSLEGSRT